MNAHKGFASVALLIIGLVIVLGGGAAWWATQKPAPQNDNSQPIQLPVAKEEVKEQPKVQPQQTQLSKDLAGVTPQFVDTQHPLAANLTESLKRDIKPFADKDWKETTRESLDWQYAEIVLRSVGARYVGFSIERPVDCGGLLQIIDAQTGWIITIREENVLDTTRAKIYIGAHNFYSYTPDTPGLVEIPGSRIADNESFHSVPEGMCSVAHEFTHTDTTITVSVDHATPEMDEDGNGIYKPFRKLTFALPQ